MAVLDLRINLVFFTTIHYIYQIKNTFFQKRLFFKKVFFIIRKNNSGGNVNNLFPNNLFTDITITIILALMGIINTSKEKVSAFWDFNWFSRCTNHF